jgi:hypothetical protein
MTAFEKRAGQWDESGRKIQTRDLRAIEHEEPLPDHGSGEPGEDARAVQEARSVNRHLSIALVSAALAFALGYGLTNVIRTGVTKIGPGLWIRRADEPGEFWTAIGLLTAAIGAIAIVSGVHFVEWISN